MDQQFLHNVATVQTIGVVPRILEVVCRSTGMGFAAVARVTESRWVACAVRDEIQFGLQPGGELEVKTTICDEIRDSNRLVVIDHVAADPNFCTHHTPAQYGFQSYISVPLRYPDGRFFGTLCAIDPRPARLNNVETIGMFEMFADLIGYHLDAADRLALSEQTLAHIQQDSELREQFIAVLGHDLRNPLAAIQASGSVIAAVPLPDNAKRALAVIERSNARMAEMIANLMDLARGKLGGGLPLDAAPVDLTNTFEEVIAELLSAHRAIELDLQLTAPVYCDRPRMGQLLSNLVANALTHGDHRSPVRVRARTAGQFELAVENGGPQIAPERLATLFHPFARGGTSSRHDGLGLGLYIASEIARAHGGTLTASSDASLTTFMLRMPLDQRAGSAV
jgi:signal transduction histidine kinase